MGSSRLFSASLRSSISTWWRPPLPSTFSVSPCPCRPPLRDKWQLSSAIAEERLSNRTPPPPHILTQIWAPAESPHPSPKGAPAHLATNVSLASVHSSHTPLTGRIIWGKSRSLVSWSYDWSSKLLLPVIVNLLFQRPPSADPESCYLQTIFFNNRPQLPHFNLIYC